MRRLAFTAGLIAIAIAIAIAVAGCGGNGGGTGDSAAQATARAAAASGARADDGPVDTGSLATVCAGTTRLTKARPYRGPGPHPVGIYGPDGGNGATTPYRVTMLSVAQPQARAFVAPPALTQLVACLQRVRSTPTGVVCRYVLSGATPFSRASYRLTVRSARTGAVVDQVLIDPAAGGCPSNVTVAPGDPRVFSQPTNGQYLGLLTPYATWDGQGRPPTAGASRPAAPASGPVLTSGSVRLTTPAGADARALALLRDYLSFWSAYEDALSKGVAYTPELRASVDPRFLPTLTSVLNRRGAPTPSGPVVLTPTVRSATAASATIDACVDESARQFAQNGQTTGQVGTRSPVRVTMTPSGGHFVAAGFADAPAGLCAANPG